MASEYFHGKTPYALDPFYKSSIFYTGTAPYLGSFQSLSTVLDPRTANQVKEVHEVLNTGIKNIEVGNVSPQVFEAIPKEHFKEMNRLAKLTGAELTFHAPLIDPTGITEHGWEKMNQDFAERQLWNAIEKSQELNPGKNIVTIHATSVPLPSAEVKVIEEGKEKIKSMLYVTPDGRIGQIRAEERFFPTEEGKKPSEIFNPEEELKKKNKDIWSENLAQLNFYAHRGEEAAEEIEKIPEIAAEEIGRPDIPNVERALAHGDLYLRDAYRMFKANFDMIYKGALLRGDKKIIKDLDEYAEKIAPKVKKFEKPIQNAQDLREFSLAIQEGVKVLKNIEEPKIIRPLKEFAIEKSAETTANLAWKAYKEYKDKAPIIALENHPAQQSLLTSGEELKKVIEQAHKYFVIRAKKEGMSEEDAKKVAEKLIGATWDVGHINMIRRYGYGKEEILKQTAEVAPHIKKIHLSDNFGFEHTEIPIGMGNVPMKEIMEKIGKEGYKIKKIIEAGDWWQHFSPGGKIHHPLMATLYPSFSQLYGVPSGYFAGYGTIFPEQHFALYGAGFTALPVELGGQVQSKESRVSGTPMA